MLPLRDAFVLFFYRKFPNDSLFSIIYTTSAPSILLSLIGIASINVALLELEKSRKAEIKQSAMLDEITRSNKGLTDFYNGLQENVHTTGKMSEEVTNEINQILEVTCLIMEKPERMPLPLWRLRRVSKISIR
ncbi:hypothetical protein M3699_10725 [Peribacillus simplex]|uniref:hypothetical protein n=1 Tax=Peribacillus simplex TaxID=1478 RepID=UPI00203E0815|nr:hypothetical protein [Peribacillus simplex]MCM3674348.1 hypothetical protein [Peribacillus simplex]